MTKVNELEKPAELLSISASEAIEIDQKVNFELNTTQFKMLKFGALANLLSGILIIVMLYKHIALLTLIIWYIVFAIINILNIIFSFHYERSQVAIQDVSRWEKGYWVALMLVCSAWSFIYVFPSQLSINYQLYMTAFLLAVLVGFSVGTITNLTSTIVCITFLLIPYIVHRLYLGIYAIVTAGRDVDLNLGFSLCVFILGFFMLIACYIGNRLIKKSFYLTFINEMLSKNLESANRLLEQRVKERTAELEESLNLVKYQATHDLLTRLPNERLLEEYMGSEIKLAEENKHMFAVFFVGLNEMDKINDGLGHQASALIVRIISKRLKSFFNKDGNKYEKLKNFKFTLSLSRRDEFVILLDPLFELEILEGIALPFFSILEEPVYINEHAIKLTASIGVSVYPKDGQDAKSLLMNADAAMRVAKQWGGNKINIYKTEINADVSKQLEIESYLHNALNNNEFRVYYQPFVSLKTGEICGMEALLRWKNPILGFISPMDFIPLAEANGIILQLGEWVLRNACSQIKSWHVQGFHSLKMAINLSAKQLQQKNIVEIVAGVLKELKLHSKYIELELTETTAFQKESIPVVKQFKAMGIGLSIDDFGTGYSGLTNLKLFTIDKLKIDKYFVQDIDVSIDSRTIVSNTIALAKKMGIDVLAEGVETKEQLKFLLENGCDMIQGYYFSPPVTAEAFTELLLNSQSLSFNDL